jgi:outer membrane protein assembly factor BamB
MYKTLSYILLLSFAAFKVTAQQTPPTGTPPVNTQVTGPMAPADLPGNGLAQHDFFYAGEGNKVMSIVRKGKVVWAYTDTTKRGEISDAVLLSNGNVLFAHQFGITEITKDKKLVWNYDAPGKTEIHTARAIGNDKVLYIQNGNPAKLFVVNMVSGKTLFEMELQVGNPLVTHPQFRHVDITDAGTLLVAHMDMSKVCEYDGSGKVIWSVDVANPWFAQRLKNGNTLITSNKGFVREVNTKGEAVWEFNTADLPEIKFSGLQKSIRLANGNTLIGNWAKKGDKTAVQAIEVSPDKKLVWALRSWDDPDLGKSTTIQILDDSKVVPEKAHFGKLK